MSYRISVQHVTKLLLLMGFAVVLLAGSSTEANTRSTCGYTFPHTATGTTDLIDALLCANQTTGESVIDLNGQVFSYSQSYNDYNGPTALPEITGQVRIQNGTIERTGSNPLRLLYVNNTGQLVLDNTTLQNGLVTNTSHDGGAVLNEGILTITSSLFQQNQAYRGGAIAGYGELLIYGSTFQQNTADLSAAIHHRYSSTFPPDFAPLIQGSLFQNNTAGGQGRILTFVGIPPGFSESQILRNTIFRDNESQSGWIVIVQNRSLLEGTHFLNNQATALYTSSNTQGELIINRSIFQGNTTGSAGGAIQSTGYLTIKNSLMTGNSAGTQGGAIRAMPYSSDPGIVSIINTTISGNVASDGAAISHGVLDPYSPTDFPVDIDIQNSIIQGHAPGNTFDNVAGVMTINHSLVQDWTGGGTGNMVGNYPLLDVFVAPGNAANAPFTGGNYRLADGSPAIDSASNTAASNAAIGSDDLDGNSRFADDPATSDSGEGTAPIIDMGAYEYQFLVDVNGDGLVTPSDAVYVINRLQSTDMSADVDSDGDVDTADVQRVLNALGN